MNDTDIAKIAYKILGLLCSVTAIVLMFLWFGWKLFVIIFLWQFAINIGSDK